METESEFGKGLTYCIGLFLAHAERKMREFTFNGDFDDGAEMWFNGAADHLYDMVIPDSLPESLQSRLRTFRAKSIDWRLGMDCPRATKADKEWAVKEAMELLRLIDQANGIETLEASWK